MTHCLTLNVPRLNYGDVFKSKTHEQILEFWDACKELQETENAVFWSGCNLQPLYGITKNCAFMELHPIVAIRYHHTTL